MPPKPAPEADKRPGGTRPGRSSSSIGPGERYSDVILRLEAVGLDPLDGS
jgi:hypothetical protein